MNSTEQAAAPPAEATRHPLSAVSRWHGRSSWATSLFFRRLLLGPPLQRDLQRELTCDKLRAAEAKGNKGGRRPAVPAAKTDTVRASYLKGRSIAALARDHSISRGAIRTAVADLLPDHTAIEEDAPPRSRRSPSTCRARSLTSSAPPNWSLPSGPPSAREVTVRRGQSSH